MQSCQRLASLARAFASGAVVSLRDASLVRVVVVVTTGKESVTPPWQPRLNSFRGPSRAQTCLGAAIRAHWKQPLVQLSPPSRPLQSWHQHMACLLQMLSCPVPTIAEGAPSWLRLRAPPTVLGRGKLRMPVPSPYSLPAPSHILVVPPCSSCAPIPLHLFVCSPYGAAGDHTTRGDFWGLLRATADGQAFQATI